MNTRLAYQRWRSRPAWARVATAVYLYAFAEGTGWHVLDLATGGHGWHRTIADPVRLLIPVGLGPITLFAIFVLVTAVPLRRTLAGVSPG